ncbi:hypothetical protein NCPPB3778_51 [Rathayibacter phage NCPPB3778]|nr:hypothetical protein NCPPB3778_51 [Rathayibacter phage NCPPB3778]
MLPDDVLVTLSPSQLDAALDTLRDPEIKKLHGYLSIAFVSGVVDVVRDPNLLSSLADEYRVASLGGGRVLAALMALAGGARAASVAGWTRGEIVRTTGLPWEQIAELLVTNEVDVDA